MVGDDGIFLHGLAIGAAKSTDIHARCDIILKFRTSMNQSGNTQSLIRSQCVHWIDDQGLNTWLSLMGIAVLQNRVKKALSFAGTGTRCNKRRYWVCAAQTVICAVLVHVGRIRRMKRLKPLVSML